MVVLVALRGSFALVLGPVRAIASFPCGYLRSHQGLALLMRPKSRTHLGVVLLTLNVGSMDSKLQL